MQHDGDTLEREQDPGEQDPGQRAALPDGPRGDGPEGRAPAPSRAPDPRAALTSWRQAEAARGHAGGPPRHGARRPGRGATAEDVGSRQGLLRMLGRAVLLRCPRCGGRGILRNWFNLRPRCPTCRLVFTRGEAEDYWLGGFTINFVVGETLVVLLVVGLTLATLPDVPWTAILGVGVVACVAAPVLFLPFSRTLFLAVDLFARPALRGDRWGSHDPQAGYGRRYPGDRR